MQVFEPTYLSTYALPHITISCDHRHTPCSFKKKRPQHFTVSKATDDVQGFARPPDTLISEGWKEKLELKVKIHAQLQKFKFCQSLSRLILIIATDEGIIFIVFHCLVPLARERDYVYYLCINISLE